MRKLLLPFICLAIISCQTKDQTLFRLVSSSESGINFSNQLKESYEENMLTFSNFYTGGGVGILDINNDGLPDILMGGNQVSCSLYLNQGNFQFEDITKKAGLTTDRWVTGISIVDINSDGFDDIYLSVSGFWRRWNTKNLLYINNGDNTFSELANAYGLDEQEQTTHTSFLDYDQDGDLDAFMAINPTDFLLFYMGRAQKPKQNGEARSTDKLYENLGNGTFIDASKKAGIRYEGYSLGVNTSDFNSDGLIDIFVTNDFVTNDILYINQGDGTFVNELKSQMHVTSHASMGNDVADFNNDGHLDLITLDMLPEDNLREKMLVPSSNYNHYQHVIRLGYQPQFTRNVLQLNNGDGTFSEIGQLAGVSRTDWSWSSIFADLNNDGHKDLHVTNGFRRDLGNLDYIRYNEHSPFSNPESAMKGQIDEMINTPGVPLPNYVFQNKGDLTFSNKTKEWGLALPTFSSGAATVDLDLDGDLDLVVNNIDMPASVYENNTSKEHFLKIELRGSVANTRGIGSRIYAYTPEGQQMIEVNPYRGYLSSVENVSHFGLGKNTKIDSLVVIWPDRRKSAIKDVPSDTTLIIIHQQANGSGGIKKTVRQNLFEEVTQNMHVDFKHKENSQVDFHNQFLLPHEHSKLGPGLAVGDVNGDGLDDFYIGGSHQQLGKLYVQKVSGGFEDSEWDLDPEYEDMGAIIFDFDGDNDNDIYIASGGTFGYSDPRKFQDRLYINNGDGAFVRSDKLPEMPMSTGTVVAADYDLDGDLDLFVGGRIMPREYPNAPVSYLLNNNQGIFEIVDLRALNDLGMVTQALWTDYDNDLDPDLLIVGEWLPITIFKNNDGTIAPNPIQLEQSSGWWNSIVPLDHNADGKLEYLLGNLSGNNAYNGIGSSELTMTAKDFDQNGSVDLLMSRQYIDGHYPTSSRDAFLGQLPYLKTRFSSYQSYAETTADQIFSEKEWLESTHHKVDILANSLLTFDDSLNHQLEALSPVNQISPLFGGVTLDLNNDGKEEALVSGNWYSVNVNNGPFTGSTGALISENNGQRVTQRGHEIGISLRGDRKALSRITLANNLVGLISTVNDGAASVHLLKKEVQTLSFQPNEFKAIIQLNDGHQLIKECYYGSGYLSQSSRHLTLPENSQKIEFISYSGARRAIVFD
ncbi:MAG: VCBS repeat-containing protein [Cyclobacteriaceae bacterium]